jgi:hypothetical protein
MVQGYVLHVSFGRVDVLAVLDGIFVRHRHLKPIDLRQFFSGADPRGGKRVPVAGQTMSLSAVYLMSRLVVLCVKIE